MIFFGTSLETQSTTSSTLWSWPITSLPHVKYIQLLLQKACPIMVAGISTESCHLKWCMKFLGTVTWQDNCNIHSCLKERNSLLFSLPLWIIQPSSHQVWQRVVGVHGRELTCIIQKEYRGPSGLKRVGRGGATGHAILESDKVRRVSRYGNILVWGVYAQAGWQVHLHKEDW